MPMSIKPVEKEPRRKYFREASLPFRLLLSLPVSIYKGIDSISIPRKSINKDWNDADMITPERIKNIRAK
jgi:hypothetical protein